MRSENEIMKLILETAKADSRIRGVVLSGSRVNCNAPADVYRDFDIIYAVRSVASFRKDPDWKTRFGEILICQEPESMTFYSGAKDGSYPYLMQFTDGNRIDLTLIAVAEIGKRKLSSLSVVMLDKDGIFPELPMPNEEDYLDRLPERTAFAECCNEFWWVSLYAAKGIARNEPTYAQGMLNGPVRDAALQMLGWYAAGISGKPVNAGKCGKYLFRYLPEELWKRFLATYCGCESGELWHALEELARLFLQVSTAVAAHCGDTVPAYAEKVFAELMKRKEKK